ncbi:helix-hairpin-helix domain-containing protein [Celeribacter sp.]|uniref:helix-hairpin-helix domain-containing protein n=1 Tax=Celeribacter sp. TaxID=1890673 RepID=UPI003A8F2886
MTDAQQAKTPKIGLIAAICGVIAFLALMWIAGYSTGASVIVGILVALLVAILLWIGWYEDTTEAPETNVGHPEADVSASGLMATSGIGDEPVSAADEIAVEPHVADTREVRSAAAAATPEADPVEEPVETVAEPVAEVEEKTEAAPVAFASVPDAAVAAEPDDLKSIKGVGPKIEVQLHERGITTFAQVAALSADEIETLGAALKGTSAAQLTKWAEQAKILATGGDTEFSKRVKDGDVY